MTQHPSDTDPSEIERELMAEFEIERQRRETNKLPPGASTAGSRATRHSDADFDASAADTAPPHRITAEGSVITSLYSIQDPASPLSALVISGILTALALVCGSGAALALVYVPHAQDAHASVAWASDDQIGAWLRGIHHWGTNVLAYLCVTYVVHLLWSGLFRRPGHWVYWRALALVGLMLAFHLTGMLLPFDQTAVHGTQIRLGYLSEIPVIGESLRAMLVGGPEIGTSTLTRFYGLHIAILPALLIMLVRKLWRDGRPRAGSATSSSMHALMILTIAALTTSAGLLMGAPHGLSGNLGEGYAEARPEWYAMPLYQLLKWLPAGPAQLVGILVLPLLGILAAFALPIVERVAAEPQRLKAPIRWGLISVGVIMLALFVYPVAQDIRDEEGWFKRYDVAKLMDLMRERNNALAHSKEPVPEDAYVQARDLIWLAHELRSAVPEAYKDDKNKAKWDGELAPKWKDWCRQLEQSARQLLEANTTAESSVARARVREACKACHVALEAEARLDPPARVVEAQPAPQPVKQPDPKARNVFDKAKFEALKETGNMKVGSGKQQMRAVKAAALDLMKQLGRVPQDDKIPRSSEQAIRDMLWLLKNHVRGAQPSYSADYTPDEWRKRCDTMEAALLALIEAREGSDLDVKLETLGKSCDTCHQASSEYDWRWEQLGK